MDRHLPTLTNILHITHALIDHLLDGESSPNEGSLFSILREDQIMIFEGGCNTHRDSCLPKTSHVEWYLSLSLTHVQHCIHFINSDHGLEYTIEGGGRYIVVFFS